MVNIKEGQIKNITILDREGNGFINASGSIITNVADPINDSDLTTKKYIDGYVAKQVSTISDLRDLSILDNQIVYCLSHSGDGYNGAGMFIKTPVCSIGTYFDNNGSIIIPLSGFGSDGSCAWKRVDNNVVTPEHFGAIGNGISNDFEPLNSAINYAIENSFKILLSKYYRCDSEILIEDGSNLEIEMTNESIIDFSNCTPSGIGAFVVGTVNGFATSIGTPSEDINYGDCNWTFLSEPDVNIDDVLIIYCDTDYSWSSHNSYYKKGEFGQVINKSGNSVTLETTSFDSYLINESIDVVKLVGTKVHIHGNGTWLFKEDETSRGLVLIGCRDSLIENIKIQGSQNSNLTLWNCFKTKIVGIKGIQSSKDIGLNHILSIGACHDCHGDNINTSSTRHSITFNNAETIALLPNRLCSIKNSTIYGGELSAALYGCTDHCGFLNCIIYGGVQLSGSNPYIQNCKIFSAENNWDSEVSTGLCLQFKELKDNNQGFETININSCDFFVKKIEENIIPLNMSFTEGTKGILNLKNINLKSIADIDILELFFINLNGISEQEVSILIKDVIFDGYQEKNPRIIVKGNSNCSFKKINIDTVNGCGIFLNDFKCPNTDIINVNSFKSDESGLAIEVLEYIDVRQRIRILNSTFNEGNGPGILIYSTNVLNDIDVEILNCEMINNGQDHNTSSEGLCSMRLYLIAKARVMGCTIGDTQEEQTQTKGFRFDSCGKIIEDVGIRRVGSLLLDNWDCTTLIRNVIKGTGTPESFVTASRGSVYYRTDGGIGTSFYVKETGDVTTTGWVAK